VHGVVFPGAHITSNVAMTFADPAPTARNTALAAFPDDR
jgi:hypothetical protein